MMVSEKNSDTNITMVLVSVIKSLPFYVEYQIPLITIELASGFVVQMLLVKTKMSIKNFFNFGKYTCSPWLIWNKKFLRAIFSLYYESTRDH